MENLIRWAQLWQPATGPVPVGSCITHIAPASKNNQLIHVLVWVWLPATGPVPVGSCITHIAPASKNNQLIHVLVWVWLPATGPVPVGSCITHIAPASKNNQIIYVFASLYLHHRPLTHSCLEINLTGAVWTCQSFENNFGINHIFFKNIWRRVVNWFLMNNSSFNIYLKIAFVREISPKLSGSFGCFRHELVKQNYSCAIKKLYWLFLY